jgi:hypothetical protein
MEEVKESKPKKIKLVKPDCWKWAIENVPVIDKQLLCDGLVEYWCFDDDNSKVAAIGCDIGYEHLAFVTVDAEGRVLKVFLIASHKGKLPTHTVVSKLVVMFQTEIELNRVLESSCPMAIEQQYDINPTARIIAHCLLVIFQGSRLARGLPIDSIAMVGGNNKYKPIHLFTDDPHKVGALWNCKGKNATKKRKLLGELHSCSMWSMNNQEECIRTFAQEDKKDDVSDAYLMARNALLLSKDYKEILKRSKVYESKWKDHEMFAEGKGWRYLTPPPKEKKRKSNPSSKTKTKRSKDDV